MDDNRKLTAEDRERYIDVLLALAGKTKDEENLSTELSTEFDKATVCGGYGLRV